MHTPEPTASIASNLSATRASRRAAVLVARSSITGASEREMQALCEGLLAQGGFETVVFAYTEQGTPTFRDALQALATPADAAPLQEVLLLPLLLPMEPGFTLYLKRIVQCWKDAALAAGATARPTVRLAPAPSETAAMQAVLLELAEAAQAAPALDAGRLPAREGATVPAQHWRVLVCQGGPCNDAGAAIVWGHLRNAQKAQNLRTEGAGVMTCKTTCLGPCGLAPVLQVLPDGTWYGGVDEAGVDRIVAEHLQGGRVVDALAYSPGTGKQWLRVAEPVLQAEEAAR